jgi:hypothetical protein
MKTNAAALIVPSPKTAATSAVAKDIRGIKGPVDVPWDWAAYQGYFWIAAFLVVAIAMGIWNRFLRRLRQRFWAQLFKKPEVKPVPPHVRARQRLHAALRHISDPRLFCFEVSETLRVYVEERFKLRAPERTTEEFLVELQSSTALDSDQKQSLAAFLESCDLVKFARFEPNESALLELHESALRLVDETQFEAVAQPAGTLK